MALVDITDVEITATGSTTARTLADRFRDRPALSDWASPQAAIDYVSANGLGELYVPAGSYEVNELILKSNVILRGAGADKSLFAAGAGTTKILRDHRFADYNKFCGFRDVGFVANGDVDVAVELAATRDGVFDNFRVSGAIKANAVALKLTGWDDAGTFRHCIRSTFGNIKMEDVYTGIHLVRSPGYSLHEGPNFNRFFGREIVGVLHKGVFAEHGEGNSFYEVRCASSDYGCVALWDIRDAVTNLFGCAGDGEMFTAFVRLLTGAAGSVDQIVVNGANALSAPVPFNTSLAQTAADVVANINTFTGTSGITALRGTRRTTEIHLFNAAGARLTQSTTAIVVAATSITTIDSGTLGGGITGIVNAWGIPEGHGGSNTIGFDVVDTASVVALNPQGNGPVDRWNFASSTAHQKSQIFRDDFTTIGGKIQNPVPLVQFTPAVSCATPGDLSISYASQGGRYYVLGRKVWVWVNLVFTPTFTTASGTISVSLPLAAAAVSGMTQNVNVGNIAGFSFGTGRTMVAMNITQATVAANIRASGTATTSTLLAASNMTSGAAHTLSFTGEYLLD